MLVQSEVIIEQKIAEEESASTVPEFNLSCLYFLLIRQAKLGTTCKLKGVCHVNCLFDM